MRPLLLVLKIEVEGALTMFFALVAMVMLPDFPHNTRFGLTTEERQVAQLRMLEDVGELDQDSREDKWYTGFVMAITVSTSSLE